MTRHRPMLTASSICFAAGYGLFLLWLGGMLLFAGRMAVWQQVGFWTVLVLAIATFLWPVARKAFGPVFLYEIVRTSRSGKLIPLRCFYAAVLLLMLFWVFTARFGTSALESDLFRPSSLPAAEMPRFAAYFFNSFLTVQFLAVLVLTPAYTAGTIAEEKERGSLDLLLTTHLHDTEIVLGKLAARLANLGLLLLTGLPLLALTQFLGGIDPNRLLVGFAATAVTLVSVGSLSVFISVRERSTFDAVVRSYLWLAGFLSIGACIPILNFANPVFALFILAEASPEAIPWILAGYVIVNGLLSAYLCHEAVKELGRLRTVDTETMRLAVRFQASAQSESLVTAVVPHRNEQDQPPDGFFVERRRRLPAIEDDALFWKETEIEGLSRLRHFNPLLVFAAIFLGPFIIWAFLIILLTGLSDGWGSEAMNIWVRCVSTPLACLILLMVGYIAAGTITRERERRTLDSLLMLPVDRADILSAKLWASAWSVRYFIAVLLVVWALGLITGGLNILAIPALAVTSLAYLLFVANLGLLFSVCLPTTLRATTMTMACCLIIAIVPLLVFPTELAVGFSPPLTLAMLTFGYERSPFFLSSQGFLNPYVFFGPVIFGILGCTLYSVAQEWFQRQNGPWAKAELEPVVTGSLRPAERARSVDSSTESRT